jgi:hypothetical protein
MSKPDIFISRKSGHFYFLFTEIDLTCPAQMIMSWYGQSRNVMGN